MSDLTKALNDYLNLVDARISVREPNAWFERLVKINEQAIRLGRLAKTVTSSEMLDAARRLLPALSVEEPQVGAETALTLGVFVEAGLEPHVVGKELLTAYTHVAALVAEFVEDVETKYPPDEESEQKLGGYSVGDRYLNQVAAQRYWMTKAEWPQAYAGFDKWGPSIVAVLARDSALLAWAKTQHRLIALSDRLSLHGTMFVRMLLRLLVDEPLLVIHPTTTQGFLLRISGITDNFQLHTLLADALLSGGSKGPADGIPGRRPDPIVVEVMKGPPRANSKRYSEGMWNLYQWTALDGAGDLPVEIEHQHWVWNEGIPADILHLEETRILILGPSTIRRTWNTQRKIGPLPANIILEKVLDRDEVRNWLKKAGQTNRDSAGN